MSEEVLPSTAPRRILLPRFDTLGDIVLLEGFLEAIMQRFPQAKITLLIRQVYADLASIFPENLDWLTTQIDPHKQSPDRSLCQKLLEDLGEASWDLVLITAHNRTWADNLVAAKMTASKRLAVGQWTEMPAACGEVFERLQLSADCPYERLIPVSEKSHEIEKYQSLWQALTGVSLLPEPRLYVNEHQKLAAEKDLRFAGLETENFCLCIPAGTQSVAIKTWPPDRFAEVIAWLECERGLRSLVAGHRSEADRVEEVAELARERGARPGTWLGRDGEIPILAAISAAAGFYLGNDTGPMHIAAAVNTPVVAIFGGGTWPRFIPRGDSSIAIAGQMPCFGCAWDCIFGNAPCMNLIEVEDVKRATDGVISGPLPKAPEDRVLSASKRLDFETEWYISQALTTHKKTDQRIAEIEADRAERIRLIERLSRENQEIEADRAARLGIISRLNSTIAEIEADRAARLELINRMGAQLSDLEASKRETLEELDRTRRELTELRASLFVRILSKLRLIPAKIEPK